MSIVKEIIAEFIGRIISVDTMWRKMMDKYNFCKKKYFIQVFDENHDKVDFELLGMHNSDGTHIDIELKNIVPIFSNEDLMYLKFLLGEKLMYGGDTVREMRKYTELYNKIEKEIKKNDLN